MTVTRLGPDLPRIMSGLGTGATSVPSGGTAGQVVTATGSNAAYWGENIARISANGSNSLLGPFVSFVAGAGILLSVASNSMTITGSSSSPTSANLALNGATVDVDTGAAYKAFPVLCVMPNGNLLLAYRSATDHATTPDGVVKTRTSSDGGVTWSAATTIWDPAAGIDGGVGGLTTLSDGRIAIIVTSYNSTGPVYSSYVMFSSDNAATWGSPVALTSSFDHWYAYGDTIEITPSRLLQPIYGAVGTGDRTAALLISTDGGATWGSQTTIATGGGHDWAEPYIVRLADGSLLCLIRVEDALQIWSTVSTDDGATWSTAALAFAGRSIPRMAQFASGAVAVIFRDSDLCYYRTSWDNGSTWLSAVALTPTGTQQEYGAWTQLASGRIVAVWSYQNSSTDADLVLQAFTDYVSETEVQDLAVRGKVGFHNATPIEQPTVTGEWANGTAGTSLADALNDLGLVHDLTIPGTSTSSPTGAAGGDLSGTYPNPSVVDDSHSHTSSTAPGSAGSSRILLADGHATPFTFNDMLQMDSGADFMWSDP